MEREVTVKKREEANLSKGAASEDPRVRLQEDEKWNDLVTWGFEKGEIMNGLGRGQARKRPFHAKTKTSAKRAVRGHRPKKNLQRERGNRLAELKRGRQTVNSKWQEA